MVKAALEHLKTFKVEVDGIPHTVGWSLEREFVDLPSLGRLMINGRIVVDEIRKVAVWSIPDSRNPLRVLHEATALLGCGWDQVWIFAPGIWDELSAANASLRVRVMKAVPSRSDAEETFRALVGKMLQPPAPETPHQAASAIQPPRAPKVSARPKKVSSDSGIDSGWELAVRDFLSRHAVNFETQQRFSLGDAHASHYTADFLAHVGGKLMIIEPHRDDLVRGQFEDKLRLFKLRYPRIVVILMTEEFPQCRDGVFDRWVPYNPPSFPELEHLLTGLGASGRPTPDF